VNVFKKASYVGINVYVRIVQIQIVVYIEKCVLKLEKNEDKNFDDRVNKEYDIKSE
jgi:hypothetical protein